MKKTLSLIVLALVLVLSSTAPATGETNLVPPIGITQAVADGLYVNETGDTGMTGSHDYSIAVLIAADAAAAGHVVTRSFGDARYPQLTAANTFTNTNIIRFAGLPLSVETTLDADDVVLFKMYAARGPGNGIDGATGSVLFQFDDDTGTSIPVQIIAVMDDADPKGGTFGSFLFKSGSVAAATIFKVDGVNDNVQASFYGFHSDIDTGMFGGTNLIQLKTSNATRFEIVEASSFARVVGYSLIVDDRLAVNTTIGALDNSVLAGFVSTTQGVLLPRMTTAQKNAISSPIPGVLVDDSDLNGLYRYSGTAWERFAVNVPTIKSGTVAGASFAGNPKVFTVTFGTAFPDANYAITINAEDNRTWTYGTKLVASFIISSNANLAFTGNVDWTATAYLDP